MYKKPFAFSEPNDAKEAENRVVIIEMELEQLKGNLESESKRSTMTPDEYFTWKKRALYALAKKRAEHKFLKAWLKQRPKSLAQIAQLKSEVKATALAELDSASFNVGDSTDLLKLAYRTLKQIARRKVELMPDEEQVVDLISIYLGTRVPSKSQ